MKEKRSPWFYFFAVLFWPIPVTIWVIKRIITPETRKSTLLGIAILFGFSCVVMLAGMIYVSSPASKATLTAQTGLTLSAEMETLVFSVAETEAANLTAALTPTFPQTLTPTMLSPSDTPTLIDTSTQEVTDTPAIQDTDTPMSPTQPPATQSAPNAGPCSCSGDLYNCSRDFTTRTQAQACYDHCVEQGVGDIHKLDGNDKDGKVCESLP